MVVRTVWPQRPGELLCVQACFSAHCFNHPLSYPLWILLYPALPLEVGCAPVTATLFPALCSVWPVGGTADQTVGGEKLGATEGSNPSCGSPHSSSHEPSLTPVLPASLGPLSTWMITYSCLDSPREGFLVSWTHSPETFSFPFPAGSLLQSLRPSIIWIHFSFLGDSDRSYSGITWILQRS